MSDYLMAIDQGTTSSRTIVFDDQAQVVASAQQEFAQHFPADGWVEHDPRDLWQSTLTTIKTVLAEMKNKQASIKALGITNQRETTLVWHRQSGEPIYNAIVWQDRRTSDYCQQLKKRPGLAQLIQAKTGLLLDPYFSASKIRWILDHVDNAQQQAEAGDLLFGTVDSYLIWRLTDGQQHLTDITNASRTLLFNIHAQQWDEKLLKIFNIPAAMLPRVKENADDFGTTSEHQLGIKIPIAGVAGDQHAALFGQACFTPGMTKSTYGTGCFMMMNTGSQAVTSGHQLLTTIGYRLHGKTHYALEGSIFMAGAIIQWLGDKLKVIAHASDCEAMAERSGADQSVYLVPAFTGLGAPHWQPDARAALVGMTRDTDIEQIVTAALQAVVYQSVDLLSAMHKDSGSQQAILKVDGGMAANNWLMQFLADITECPVARPHLLETTAMGVAFLAGLQVGVYPSQAEIETLCQQQQRGHFTPQMTPKLRNKLLTGWRLALTHILTPGD